MTSLLSCVLLLSLAQGNPDRGNPDRADPLGDIRTPEAWAKRRQKILDGMQEVMGKLPEHDAALPLDVRYENEETVGNVIRKKLTFQAAPGHRVPGYLLRPIEISGKVPGILCPHQTNGALGSKEPAGLGGLPNLHYALHLAQRGYVTLAIDYPSFGAYPFDFAKSPLPSGSMRAIADNRRALDLLQSLPEVHRDRLGCIGHSLGGHNTMFTAAFDPRIIAIVSNCGFTSFPKYYGGKLKGWTSSRYMPRIDTVYQLDPAKVPFDFPEIVASFAPRAFLASSPVRDSNFEVSGVKDCIAAAQKVYDLLGAKDRMAANYPDCAHDFPPDVRATAYQFLDRQLLVK